MASPALFLSGILAVSTLALPTQDPFLFDFTTCSQSDIDAWREVSDTVRTVGMSKAVLALQTTRVFQRAVMFAVINPQPNGAGFAGMQTAMPSSAASHVTSTGLRLQVRGQGELQYWKVVLTGKDQVGTNRTDYEQKFKLQKISNREFETVDLDFSKFGAYRRGKPVKDAPPLDLANTGTFGFQTFGGVYDGYKQKGTGSLEIDSVEFY
ncbi:hypothetical protein ACHWQZ_G018022 [Mnemiopsis leidyi]